MTPTDTEIQWVFPQDQWKSETQKYVARIAALNVISSTVKDQLARFPGLLSYCPSRSTAVKHRTLIFANQSLASAQELVGSIQLLWANGHLLAAAHCVRLLFEVWASLLFAQLQVLRVVAEGGDAEAADELLQRLLLGTNSAPLLPAGIQEQIKVVQVRKFKETGGDAAPGFKDTYGFLCDISHPTYMHSFFHFIRYDFQWSNPLGAKEMHRILDQVTSAAEQAVVGTQAAIIEIYTECIPAIEAETARKNVPNA